MKKRIFSLLTVLALVCSLTPAAFARGGFSDVTDAETARNVEVLRLMGVVDGSGNGMFRPYDSLTRAEFCKMVVELAGKGAEVVRYRSRTIFPDVRPAHWAAGYVNFAVSWPDTEGATRLIHGMPDGTFQPDRNITYGEAVTILMRLLAYTDADSGGLWPQGYISLAASSGVAKGVSLGGDAAITRAQAAKLFVNALGAKTKSGASYAKLSDETTLLSVDVAKGELRLAGGTTYAMTKPTDSTELVGLRGRVVLDDNGKALSFLPTTAATGGGTGGSGSTSPSSAAIIVSADGSTEGFDALTGGATGYAVYRNGVRSSTGALRRYDVVTYSPSANAIFACDTRVPVYYENCTPSQSAPVSVTVLGGTQFSVLPTAQQSFAGFRPGQRMILLLTADGQAAGAVSTDTSGAQGNAFAYVGSGGTYLICGGTMLKLTLSGASTSAVSGKVVRIAQNGSRSSDIYLTAQTGGVSGALDVAARTVGGRRLADGALIFKDGAQTALSALGVTRVDQSGIVYARSNAAGEIDLLVLGVNTGSEVIGRVVISVADGAWVWNAGKGENEPKVENSNGKTTDGVWEWFSGHGIYAPRTAENGSYTQVKSVTLDCGSAQYGPFAYAGSLVTGDFASAMLNDGGTSFINLTALEKLEKVPASSWVGTSAVNYGGRTYTVASSALCWNRDSGTWFADLNAARAYGGTVDLYVRDGVVRVVDVTAR